MASDFVKNRIVELFGGGKLYCAESVVQVIAESGGKRPAEAVRMATGFCSGASRTCGQCGAVSGAIMGIGLYAGRNEPGGDYEPAYSMVQEFLEKFSDKWDSINCFELIGCDFSTAEGQERFKEKRLVRRCIGLAVFAADTAIAILREHGYLPDEEEFTKSRMAPCGLMCGKCVAFKGGPVQEVSRDLKAQLGDNFDAYAKRFELMNPLFGNYPAFAELLDFFASGSCEGCREKGCLFKECTVTKCVKTKGVDYCFQCDEFPCDRHGFPERLAAIWRVNNEKMRDSGVSEQFRLCNDKPRYP